MNEQHLEPQTLMDAVKLFADPQVCHDFLVSMRWPNGPTCAHCGSCDIGEIKSRRIFQCKACRRQFSVKVGTIFEDSALGLDKWFCAIWMVTNCKNGVSSCEIGRELGVSQKSAWHMLHRIRLAMQNESFEKLSGTVEVDETYIGGKARNMHKSKKARTTGGNRGMVGKVAVAGLLERKGEVRTQIIEKATRKVLDPLVRANVEVGSEVHTDALASYSKLADEYIHKVIDHAEAYVVGNVHTNGLENFWSLLKRGLRGTYVSVEPFHLFRYLDEQAFRFNARKLSNAERFLAVVSGVSGKRLTYATLTADEPVPAH